MAVTRLNDARSVRSQGALKDSLLRLMQSVAYGDITIRQILADAKVSYPTFYRHYETIDDLLADIANGEVRAFMTQRFESSRKERGLTPGEAICTYVDGRRPVWRALLSEGAAPIMRGEFIRVSRENAARGPRYNPRFPVEVMSAVVASGFIEIIAWWLHRAVDHPIGEVAAMLDWLVINPATRRAADAPAPLAQDDAKRAF